MAKRRMTVKGDKELAAKLAKLRGVARGPLLAVAAQAGILPINNTAQANAPYKSGTLRRSIHPELVAVSDTYAEAATGTDVVYAARVEFGYKGPDALGREFHYSGTPYMRSAYDSERENAANTAAAVLKQLVEDAAS